MAAAHIPSARGKGFQHEALFYAGSSEFLAGTTVFIRDALAADEPCLVVVDAAKIDALRDELGPDAERVRFGDMAHIGANPARIIPAWREFAEEHASSDGGIWGIGEPIWPGRTAAEMSECHRHEALLNIAFASHPGFRLLCPYDVAGLDSEVLARAGCNHGAVDVGAITGPFDEPLPDPPVAPRELPFERETVRLARRFVAAHARGAGITGDRLDDLVLAVDELASNSVRHGGGAGLLRVWQVQDEFLSEVCDEGPPITDPLVGRVRPTGDTIGGYGMWMVNQLCDLVQIRSARGGNTVRVHTHL